MNAQHPAPTAPDATPPLTRPTWWPAETAPALGQAPDLLAALLGPAGDEELYRRIYSYGDGLALGLELGQWELSVSLTEGGATLYHRGDGGALTLGEGWREDLAELGRLMLAVAAAPALRPVEVADVVHDMPETRVGLLALLESEQAATAAAIAEIQARRQQDAA